MSPTNRDELIRQGMSAGEGDMYDEDMLWSEHSGDKTDISDVMMGVIRDIDRSSPPRRRLRALSIGSGPEPQFTILQSAFRGGLFLLDIDDVPLKVIRERVNRHGIRNVTTVLGDYRVLLSDPARVQETVRTRLGDSRFDLVTLHHSLYYSPESEWHDLFHNIRRNVLCRRNAVHAVMMASSTRSRTSTTWLYNHFAGKYFGCRNDQNLRRFGRELSATREFHGYSFRITTHRVEFFIDDFSRFMAVVWMILLYPDVHDYTLPQRREITAFMLDEFWMKREPLVQMQDHLIITAGLR